MTEAKRAVVTGASAGFGQAAVRALVAAGYRVLAGARREDRLAALAQETGAEVRRLDVRDDESVEAFTAGLEPIHLLVNNAGLALGVEAVGQARLEDWQLMYETNVLGTVRMVRALLPSLVASGDGHIINIGSIAGFETYPGGGGYTASKHAVRALTRTLRLELLGQPVRITEICPGLAETEFSQVRFRGDEARAKQVYQGLDPLRAEDIAECIVWAASRPSHVNIDEIVVRPRDQATAAAVARRGV
jgi:NADP-dependent 3-hydroxy acid dehydrogenase YdfG